MEAVKGGLCSQTTTRREPPSVPHATLLSLWKSSISSQQLMALTQKQNILLRQNVGMYFIRVSCKFTSVKT
jgi:hypothetical protein